MIDENKLIEERPEWLNPNCVGNEEYNKGWNACNKYWCNTIKQHPKVGEWIPCSEKMPENEVDVLITYERKNYKTGDPMYFVAMAFYEDGTLTTEDSDYCWNDIDNLDYCEEKYAYIIPEGWFETVNFGDEFGVVDMPVVAWRPIPEPYRE